MLVLAIETSALAGSVALLDAGQLLAERPLTPGQRSARSLIPSIDELLRGLDRPLADVKLIGVTIGPGSFTGLRVGVTAAKTLAYAIGAGAETLGVDTLEVIAAQTPAPKPSLSPRSLHVVLDAQRQELFVAQFQAAGDSWQRLTPTSILPVEQWLTTVRPGDLLNGPGLTRIAKRLPDHAALTPEDQREPTAAAVGRLAWTAYQNGQRHDLWTLTPAYYRPSAAEEKSANASEKRR